MMKKIVRRLGAAALAMCMMLSMMISASAVLKYYVKVEIADNKGNSVSYTSPSVSKSTDTVASVVAGILTSKYRDIESNFTIGENQPVLMGDLLRRGMEAYNNGTDAAAWSNWVTENYQKAEGADDLVEQLKDVETKVEALEKDKAYAMTYEPTFATDYWKDDPAFGNKYTFTVTLISKNVAVGGGGGGSTPSTPSTPSDPTPSEPGTTPEAPKDVVVDVPAATTPDAVVTLPVEDVKVGDDTKVVVNTKSETPVKVEIPVTETTPGTVAVIIKADGTEQIIRDSVVTEKGVVTTVSNGDKIVIKDNTKTFSDVTDAHWGKNAVTFVAARGIFAGTGDGTTFSPDVTTSRGMIAQVLHNLEYNVENHLDGHFFNDVHDHHWYDKAVHWAEDHGIVGGYPDGSFQGEKNVSREELVVMLWNYAGKQASKSNDHVDAFNDADKVSDWAKAAMNWALENGILGGKGGKMLDPTGMATRAELAQMMKNFCENK